MRKSRADKKIHIAPTVPIRTKELLYSLAYLLDCPVKTLAETIIIECSEDPRLIEELGTYCARDIKIGNVLIVGNKNARLIDKIEGDTARVSIRLHRTLCEGLKGLSYAIGCSNSKAALLMIETSLDDCEFMMYVCSRFIGFSDNEKEIRKLIEGYRTVVERVVDFVINRWNE